MHPLVETNLSKIEALCKKHFMKDLYLFGSAARGDFNDENDFDFAYAFDYDDFINQPIDTWRFDPFIEFDDFKNALRKLLKRKIDLVPYNSLHNPYFKKSIDEDKVLLYDKENTHIILA
jgi:uncharacterized protein